MDFSAMIGQSEADSEVRVHFQSQAHEVRRDLDAE